MTLALPDNSALVEQRHLASRAAEVVLCVLIAYVPWPLGTVHAWSELVVHALSAALVLCLLARVLIEKRPFIWSWAYVPVALFIGYLLFTVLPLPAGLVRTLSPAATQIRAELLSHHANAAGVNATISMYPAATWAMIRLVVTMATIFVTVLNICDSPAVLKRLLLTMAVVGGLVALLAVCQTLTYAESLLNGGTGKIYWVREEATFTGGPFICYNNFCQFINLCMGGALALLLYHRHRLVRTERPVKWSDVHNPTVRAVWITGLALAIGALGVLLSISRAGVISLLVAGICIGLLLALRRKAGGSAKPVALVVLLVVGCLLIVGFDVLMARLSTLSSFDKASPFRAQCFNDVLTRMVPQFLPVGIGLGAHEVVYPMFSTVKRWCVFQYVENEYIQLLQETGLVGVLIVTSFLGTIAWHLIAAIRRRGTALSWVAIGLTYGLIATAIHSFTDFGQRITSVACLSALTVGMVLAIRRIPAHEDGNVEPAPLRAKGALTAAIVLALAAVSWAFLLIGSTRAAVAEWLWGDVKTAIATSDLSNVERHLAVARRAAAWAPDNYIYRYWLVDYELAVMSGNTALSAEAKAAENRRLIAAFHAVQRICPTFSFSYAMAGQLRMETGDVNGGSDEVRKAYQLSPQQKIICAIAGECAATQGRWDEARARFMEAIDLHWPVQSIAELYVKTFKKPEEAIRLFQGHWGGLEAVAALLEAGKGDSQTIREIREKAGRLILEESQKESASSQVLAKAADVYLQQRDMTMAEKYIRDAIAKEYRNADFHLALAQILAQTGRRQEAIKEARNCLSLRRDMPGALKLISDLSVEPSKKGPG